MTVNAEECYTEKKGEVAKMQFFEGSTIGEIYENEQGRALLEQYLPKLVRSPSFPMTRAMSFRAVCRFRRHKLKRKVYAEALSRLEEIR